MFVIRIFTVLEWFCGLIVAFYRFRVEIRKFWEKLPEPPDG